MELEPTCLRGVSPVLIARACQLTGLLINTSGARRPDEIIAASGIKHVEVAPAWLSGGGEGELESFASFGQRGVDAVEKVFTFDREERLVTAFRGVRMRRMKLKMLAHLVQAPWGMGCSRGG